MSWYFCSHRMISPEEETHFNRVPAICKWKDKTGYPQTAISSPLTKHLFQHLFFFLPNASSFHLLSFLTLLDSISVTFSLILICCSLVFLLLFSPVFSCYSLSIWLSFNFHHFSLSPLQFSPFLFVCVFVCACQHSAPQCRQGLLA